MLTTFSSDHEHRDQHQVAVLEDQREPALLAQRLLGCSAPPRGAAFVTTPVDHAARAATHDDERWSRRADEQARRSPNSLTTGAGPHRTHPGAQAAADADEREQPLALLLRVEVAGERPELGDHHHVEDADPQEVDDADVQAGAERGEEQREVAATKNSVTHCTSRTRLTRDAKAPYAGTMNSSSSAWPADGVALHRGAALAEDEHLARGLEQVVRREDEEHQQRHQQHAGDLVVPDVGDRRQQTLGPSVRVGSVGAWSCAVSSQAHAPRGGGVRQPLEADERPARVGRRNTACTGCAHAGARRSSRSGRLARYAPGRRAAAPAGAGMRGVRRSRLADRRRLAGRVVEGEPHRLVGGRRLREPVAPRRRCRTSARPTRRAPDRRSGLMPRQVGAADLVAALDQHVGEVAPRRFGSLNWPVLTAARISSSVNAITRRAAQNASSSRISM